MKAIFVGTFDPFTSGHRDVVERALGIFGEVVVAVAGDTGKNTVSLEDRVEIAKAATSDLSGVTVDKFYGLTSDYLENLGECVIVRGVRNSRDMEYERDLARVYKSQCGKDTVFFNTAAEYEHISSTTVRELAKLGGNLDDYIVSSSKQLILKFYGKQSESRSGL